MFSPIVQLRSGGYIVINQTEALVAIDVNSGRATREHHIEDTALKTNCEAAEEIARQLRLRDLAGLIVIDFIDMDEKRNNRTVERRMKDALKNDRARIQVGRISHFGLLEMSRQRIRSSVLESSTEKCPICGGSGHVRSVSSVALQLLRALEEMLIKGATHNLIVRTRSEVALYVLNHKRAHLRELEERFRVTLTISADATVTGQVSYIIDRGEQVHSVEAAKPWRDAARRRNADRRNGRGRGSRDRRRIGGSRARSRRGTCTCRAEAAHEGAAREGAPEGERDGGRRRRRRGRGGRGRGGEPREPREGGPQQFTHDTVPEHAVAHEDHDAGAPEEDIGGEQGERPPAQGGALARAVRIATAGTAADAADAADDAIDAVAMAKRPSPASTGARDFTSAPISTVSDEDASTPCRRRSIERPKPPIAAEARPVPPPRADVQERFPQEPRRGAPPALDDPRAGIVRTKRAPSPALPPPQPVISSTGSGRDAARPSAAGGRKRLLGDKS